MYTDVNALQMLVLSLLFVLIFLAIFLLDCKNAWTFARSFRASFHTDKNV